MHVRHPWYSVLLNVLINILGSLNYFLKPPCIASGSRLSQLILNTCVTPPEILPSVQGIFRDVTIVKHKCMDGEGAVFLHGNLI